MRPKNEVAAGEIDVICGNVNAER